MIKYKYRVCEGVCHGVNDRVSDRDVMEYSRDRDRVNHGTIIGSG